MKESVIILNATLVRYAVALSKDNTIPKGKKKNADHSSEREIRTYSNIKMGFDTLPGFPRSSCTIFKVRGQKNDQSEKAP